MALDRKKIAIISVVGFILFVVILTVIWYAIQRKAQQESVNEKVEISDLDIQNSSSNGQARLEIVRETLYQVIVLNNGEITPPEDVAVREGSFEQTYDESVRLNQVKFIVDIPSLSQSYKIQYDWGNNNDSQENPNIGMNSVLCLPKDLMIYEDFQCKDLVSEQAGLSSADPIIDQLPYYGTYYNINYVVNDSDLSLSITINMSAPTRPNNQVAWDQYKEQALSVIRDWGFNPVDYNIEYYDIDSRRVF